MEQKDAESPERDAPSLTTTFRVDFNDSTDCHKTVQRDLRRFRDSTVANSWQTKRYFGNLAADERR